MRAIRVVRRPEGNFDRMCKEVVFTAMMRSGAPTDMANAVLLLASDQASNVNGAVGRIASGGR